MHKPFLSIVLSLALMASVTCAQPAAERPVPADFLRVESKAWSRWLDETIHITWTRVPLKDVLAGEFGPAALGVDPQEELATPITFDADKLSRRAALWRLSQQYGFAVRWMQKEEPREFMGVAETETLRRSIGGVAVTTMTQVMRSDYRTYEWLKKADRIKKEWAVDHAIYFAIEIDRDLRFDNNSAAWFTMTERYKTTDVRKPGTTAPAADAASGWKITLRKQDDTASIATDGDRTIVSITSRRGIGAATIEPNAGKWPQTLVVRLHLRGLEFLAVSNGKVKISAAWDGKLAREHLWAEDGEGPALDEKNRYWMSVRAFDKSGKPATGVPLKEGWFEITLPKAMLEEGRSLALEWIDFYRG